MQDIGLGVNPPRNECGDPRCPFHGKLRVRGRILQGTVVSDSSTGTVMVRRDYLHYVPKYLRYERRHSHISAHNPPCINAKLGDRVTIAECRPLSKTVAFVVVEKQEAE